MPSPLGEGQTVPPKNRHYRGEVPSVRDRFSSLNRWDKSLPQFMKVEHLHLRQVQV